jgi:hypothetical protein
MGLSKRYSLSYIELTDLTKSIYPILGLGVSPLRMSFAQKMLSFYFNFRSGDLMKGGTTSSIEGMSLEWYGKGNLDYKIEINSNLYKTIVLEEERMFSLRFTSLLCGLPFDKEKVVCSSEPMPGA